MIFTETAIFTVTVNNGQRVNNALFHTLWNRLISGTGQQQAINGPV